MMGAGLKRGKESTIAILFNDSQSAFFDSQFTLPPLSAAYCSHSALPSWLLASRWCTGTPPDYDNYDPVGLLWPLRDGCWVECAYQFTVARRTMSLITCVSKSVTLPVSVTFGEHGGAHCCCSATTQSAAKV